MFFFDVDIVDIYFVNNTKSNLIKDYNSERLRVFKQFVEGWMVEGII